MADTTSLVVLGADLAATRPRSLPPISACRSRSSTREESRRRLPVSRLHSVEGAAARRQADRRIAARHATGASTFGEPKIDVDKLRDFKTGVVDKLTGGAGQAGEAAQGQRTSRAARRFVDAKTLKVALTTGGEQRRARSSTLIIATGSRADEAAVALASTARACSTRPARSICRTFRSRCWSSAAATSVSSWARVYAALGTKVSVVEMTPGLLPGADRDLVRAREARREDLRDR